MDADQVQHCNNLMREYANLVDMAIDRDGVTTEWIDEAEKFLDAVAQVMGETSGLGMVMVSQIRRLILWGTPSPNNFNNQDGSTR